jgi:hypothetical protein
MGYDEFEYILHLYNVELRTFAMGLESRGEDRHYY